MSNVVPQETRKSIANFYRSRFLIAFGAISIMCAALSALALLPSYLALRAADIPSTSAMTQQASEEDRSAVARTQALLGVIKPLTSTSTTPVQALVAALDARPSRVRVDHMTYTPGTTGVLTLSGEADSSSALDSYRRALAVNALFASVVVPVSDLIGIEGGSFSMTISGDF